jgi:uncharacterized membrane protein
VRRSSLALPGLLLGVGVGGFVDGIVFHQLLQFATTSAGRSAGISPFWRRG